MDMANGQLPPGSVIDIAHTAELKVGDYIVIEGLGWIARQYLGVGDPAILMVFHFDRRPGISKVGVKSTSGTEHWFDDGTKAELLSAFQNKASFDKLYIWRPTPRPVPESAPPGVVTREMLLATAKALEVPATHGPVAVKTYGDLVVGDYLLTSRDGKTRLWEIVEVQPANVIFELLKTTVSGDKIGDKINPVKTSVVEPQMMVFRQGVPWPKPVVVVRSPSIPVRQEQGVTRTGAFAGALAASALGYILWDVYRSRH